MTFKKLDQKVNVRKWLGFCSSEMSTLEWPILRSSFSLLHICHENFCKAGLLGFYILMCTLNHPKAILVYLFQKKFQGAEISHASVKQCDELHV